MSEKPKQEAAEQAPAQELTVLSPPKLLSHWQIDQDIAAAISGDGPAPDVEVLKFKKTLIDEVMVSIPDAKIPSHYKDPDTTKRVREFEATHGLEEDLDPALVRAELAMRARWSLSGHAPDDFSIEDRKSVESGWLDASRVQREIEKLVDRRDNVHMKWANRTLETESLTAQQQAAARAGGVAVGPF